MASSFNIIPLSTSKTGHSLLCLVIIVLLHWRAVPLYYHSILVFRCTVVEVVPSCIFMCTYWSSLDKLGHHLYITHAHPPADFILSLDYLQYLILCKYCIYSCQTVLFRKWWLEQSLHVHYHHESCYTVHSIQFTMGRICGHRIWK